MCLIIIALIDHNSRFQINFLSATAVKGQMLPGTVMKGGIVCDS